MNVNMIKSLFEKNKSQKNDLHVPPIAAMLFGVFMILGTTGAFLGSDRYPDVLVGAWVIVCTFIGTYLLFALKVASQWEKVVVLRLGKFIGLKGPGLFWLIPVIDTAVM